MHHSLLADQEALHHDVVQQNVKLFVLHHLSLLYSLQLQVASWRQPRYAILTRIVRQIDFCCPCRSHLHYSLLADQETLNFHVVQQNVKLFVLHHLSLLHGLQLLVVSWQQARFSTLSCNIMQIDLCYPRPSHLHYSLLADQEALHLHILQQDVTLFVLHYLSLLPWLQLREAFQQQRHFPARLRNAKQTYLNDQYHSG